MSFWTWIAFLPEVKHCFMSFRTWSRYLISKVTKHTACCDYWTVFIFSEVFSAHQLTTVTTRSLNNQSTAVIWKSVCHFYADYASDDQHDFLWLTYVMFYASWIQRSWLFWVCVSSTGLVSCTWSASTAMSRAKEERVWRWCRTNPMRTPTTARDSSLRNAFISTSE